MKMLSIDYGTPDDIDPWMHLVQKVGSGFVVQQKFVAVHSCLNKLTGLLLFLFPLTLAIVEIKYTGSVVCAIATLAAIHEGHFIRRRGKQI